MSRINNCTCGQKATMDVRLWKTYPKGYYMQCECGKKTNECFTAEQAIQEWNALNKNFPTCGECEHFEDPGLCKMHDTGTEEKWTCPDCLPDIEVYTHSHNKNLLESNFGAVGASLLGEYDIDKMVDWKAEHEKLAHDYKEDVADLKENIKEVTDAYQYWFSEWQKSVKEVERLNMLLDKIGEVVEGIK